MSQRQDDAEERLGDHDVREPDRRDEEGVDRAVLLLLHQAECRHHGPGERDCVDHDERQQPHAQLQGVLTERDHLDLDRGRFAGQLPDQVDGGDGQDDPIRGQALARDVQDQLRELRRLATASIEPGRQDQAGIEVVGFNPAAQRRRHRSDS